MDFLKHTIPILKPGNSGHVEETVAKATRRDGNPRTWGNPGWRDFEGPEQWSRAQGPATAWRWQGQRILCPSCHRPPATREVEMLVPLGSLAVNTDSATAIIPEPGWVRKDMAVWIPHVQHLAMAAKVLTYFYRCTQGPVRV